MWLKITTKSSLTVGVLYRLPHNLKFFDKMEKALEKVWTKYKNIILVSDSNVNFNAATQQQQNEAHVKTKMDCILKQFNCSVINRESKKEIETTKTTINLVIVNNRQLVKNV